MGLPGSLESVELEKARGHCFREIRAFALRPWQVPAVAGLWAPRTQRAATRHCCSFRGPVGFGRAGPCQGDVPLESL